MTKNQEDYLKAIYELGGQINQVSNKDIAKALDISAPSVSEMIKKLLNEGYVEYTLYHGVKLTKLGVKKAIKVRKRHLLWEVFLVEKLGYSWDKVHEEAERLEHVTSVELENRLEKYLNYPKTCPHGAPIEVEYMEDLDKSTLATLSIGEYGKISRFMDRKELLDYVDELGLEIGDTLKVESIAPYNGPITLNKEDKIIIIGKEAANKIYVN